MVEELAVLFRKDTTAVERKEITEREQGLCFGKSDEFMLILAMIPKADTILGRWQLQAQLTRVK